MSFTRAAGAAKSRSRQSGMSMIELLIAMLVLVVGMMGSMILVRTAITGNNRNKLDTASTALAQMVMEEIIARPAKVNTAFVTTDCAGNLLTINPTGAASPGAGATVAQATGTIDYNQNLAAVPAGYSMTYITCGDAAANSANARVTYEIRWNVQTMSANTKLVTVSARKQITTAAGSLPYFSVPVTLRGVAGN
ncbi:MAG TPA: prepilin-type N-terminal cleavage/methylation domain-containing protein [Terriglobales bacterium]|nr:prepilin-type N-terminal cleavage/methylation domain-containing protein [Terriglobales bacterium]